MINTKLRPMRGDTVLIPIEAKLIVGATYRCQLRKNAEADEFLVLAIVENNILLPAEQSATLEEDTYLVELEENDGGTVSTVQRTVLFVKNDVTRTYGTEAPAWTTDQSVEVAEMITKNMLIRKLDNSLIDVATIAVETEVAKDAAIAATAEMIQDTSDAIIAVDNAETLRAAKEAQRVTAESARVQAESTRQTNTQTAITNTETATTQANDAAVYANAQAALIEAGLTIVPRIFESYANLTSGVELTLPGTDFEPVLNLRPANVQVFYNGELKQVPMKYVVNGDNYDVKLTASENLPGAEIFLLGTMLKFLAENFWQEEDTKNYFIEEETGIILTIEEE